MFSQTVGVGVEANFFCGGGCGGNFFSGCGCVHQKKVVFECVDEIFFSGPRVMRQFFSGADMHVDKYFSVKNGCR